VSAQERPSPSRKTRDRIVRTAFQLFHEQGYNATGVATIVREADVNPGSLYHFFESKDALLLGVLEFALGYLGEAVMDPVEAQTSDPMDRVFTLLNHYRRRMERERCRLGCPIGNLALEVSDGNADARRLVHTNFENWASRVEGWLTGAGDRLPADVDRRQLARFVLTVMEGGLMQSRAAGHLGPFDESVGVLRDYFRRLDTRPSKARRRAPAPRHARKRRTLR
jgi:TetR/AcrR family transcriptional regulator, transcriptional repressor for nem operon